MANPELLDAEHVVGLDIGDGESALAWRSTDRDSPVQIYQRQSTAEKSILTALARDPHTGGYLFGEEALPRHGSIQFNVNFKQMPVAGKMANRDAVLFAQALLGEFFEARAQVREACVVFIGHPAGWSATAVKEYRNQLEQLGLPVYLLAESQSALVHVRERGLSGRELLDRVLVIDIGSSTIDFTVVEDMTPKNLDVGANLGCKEIDNELAEMARKALAGYPEFTDALSRDGGPALLILACRYAKEAQFSGRPRSLLAKRWSHELGLVPIVNLGSGWLKGQEIPRIVMRNDGWATRFERLIEKVRQRLGDPPGLIILTGGGSRMPFIRNICEQAFPGTALDIDDDPSLSVASGLASAGYQRVRIAEFRHAMNMIAVSADTREFIHDETRRAFERIKTNTVAALRTTRPSKWDLIAEQPPGQEQISDKLTVAINDYLVPRAQRVCAEYAEYGIDDSRFGIHPTMPAFFAGDLALPSFVAGDLIRRISAPVNKTITRRYETPYAERVKQQYSARVQQQRQSLQTAMLARNVREMRLQRQGLGSPRVNNPYMANALIAVIIAFIAVIIVVIVAVVVIAVVEGIKTLIGWLGARQRGIDRVRNADMSAKTSSPIIQDVVTEITKVMEERAHVVERWVV
jgi:hypothetical protein